MPTAPSTRSVTTDPQTLAGEGTGGATLASPAIIAGTTLFTAAHTTLIIRPAPAGHGLVFRRTDLADQPRIPALITHLVPESRHTVLAADPSDRAAATSPSAPVVHTTEHILSALAAMGVTDALLDLHGPEVPIGDGSAAPFTEAIAASGVRPHAEAPAGPAPIRVRERIEVADRAATIEILPPQPGGEGSLDLEYRLDYGASAPIGAQRAAFRLTYATAARDAAEYRRDIAPARTFCLVEEAQAMQKMGLFRHLQPKDMLVIGEDGRPIDNAFRFDDEPARHKLLDLLGDLALTGRPIIGRVIASRSGHSLNHEAARRLLALTGT